MSAVAVCSDLSGRAALGFTPARADADGLRSQRSAALRRARLYLRLYLGRKNNARYPSSTGVQRDCFAPTLCFLHRPDGDERIAL
jgi:hypothetical protein